MACPLSLSERKQCLASRAASFAAVSSAAFPSLERVPGFGGGLLQPGHCSASEQRYWDKEAAKQEAAKEKEAADARANRVVRRLDNGKKRAKEVVEETPFERELKEADASVEKQDAKVAARRRREKKLLDQHRNGVLDRWSMCMMLAKRAREEKGEKGEEGDEGLTFEACAIAAEIETRRNAKGELVKPSTTKWLKAIAALRKELLMKRFHWTLWAQEERVKAEEKASRKRAREEEGEGEEEDEDEGEEDEGEVEEEDEQARAKKQKKAAEAKYEKYDVYRVSETADDHADVRANPYAAEDDPDSESDDEEAVVAQEKAANKAEPAVNQMIDKELWGI